MPQDAKLLEFAKRTRHEATPFEAMLWRHLSSSQLGGHKFRRQHVIERAIVDFFCPAKGLIIEVDGETHRPDVDFERDGVLAKHGYRMLRFTNTQVAQEMEAVLTAILAAFDAAPDRWGSAAPHPIPSPEGEGL